jgi:hypothetical protein
VDRDSGYLSLAAELARERDVRNVRFLELDFSVADARLSLAHGPVTLVVNRRGPTADKWLDGPALDDPALGDAVLGDRAGVAASAVGRAVSATGVGRVPRQA